MLRHCLLAGLLPVQLFVVVLFLPTTADAIEPHWLSPRDKIVIIGNTLAERLQFNGYLETRIQARFPDYQLTVRNLGWSADEIDLRPRSANFDDHGHTLKDHRPDVIFAMFGFNESFGGQSQIESFRKRFRSFIAETLKEVPGCELIVFSPIPHENLSRPELPDGSATNRNLLLYADAMEQECLAAKVQFVDLFQPMQSAMKAAANPLTINGIHLNDRGNQVLSEVIDQLLFDEKLDSQVDLERLRQAVIEKDRQFRFDYRAVNGYYIYGGRKSPYGVVNFPDEFAKLRKMIAIRDQRIWDLAAGKDVSANIDDSATGDLPVIESNVSQDLQYLSPPESLARFKVQDGYTIELVASEVEFPELVNPVALDIDSRGRLWVTTTPCYPQYLPGTPVDDKILILEDNDGDGRSDKQTVFADGLHLPIGISLMDGGAYVSQQPDLIFLKDTDGDDVADEKVHVLHGFDSADSHHSISAFTVGPDGALYMQEGTFHHTQVETPYGPQRVKDAAVFRYEPRTERFSIFVSYSFANPWGHCFDRWGQDFVGDASPGANYFAAAFSGDVIYPQKHRQMEQFLKKQWRPTCGCVLVENSHFGPEEQGNYLLNNTIGFLGTLQYKMRDEGSGFKADPVEPLLSSTDTNFRPVDLKFGPDGALYIVDWLNPLIGHMQHNLRDPKRDKHHGRIWRIRHKERPLLKLPKIEDAGIQDLMELLASQEAVHRDLARREIRTRDRRQVIQAIDAFVESRLKMNVQSSSDEQREHDLLEALWMQQQLDCVSPALLQRLLESPDFRARAAATRLLSYWQQRIPLADEWLIKLASDPAPRVRLEAVRAASFYTDADKGRDIVSIAATHPLDYYLNYTITETNATLDRRGGKGGGASEMMIAKLAAGEIADDQLAAVTQVVVQNADPAQLARITNAIMGSHASVEAKATALRNVLLSSRTRKIQPSIDTDLAAKVYREAANAGDEPIATAIADLAAAWTMEELTEPLREVSLRADTPEQTIEASWTALFGFPTPRAYDIRRELAGTKTSARLKLLFAKVVAATQPKMAVDAIQVAMQSELQPVDHELLVNAFNATADQPAALELLSTTLKVPAISSDEAKLLLRSLFAHGKLDGALVDQLRQAAGMNGETIELDASQRSQLIAKIESEGDAERGEAIYRRKDLNCAQCHAITGAGGNVGPDLSSIGVTSPTEYLVDSILYPSKQMKEAFLTLNVVTVDGTTLRGIKVDRDDSRLVLRDEKGQDVVISIEDIEAEADGKSLMPEGLHQLLTKQELIDLVAYLAALGKPGRYAVNQRSTIQRYQLLSDQSIVERLAGLAEGKLEGELETVETSAWSTVYASADGQLRKEWIAGPLPLLILKGEIDVVTPGPLAALVQSECDVQVVVNGRSTTGNGQQTVEFTEGRHAIFLIIERPEKLMALTTELLRPANAKTQFTVVGGI